MHTQSKESKDFRETLYTIDSRGNRSWVYPTIQQGRFRNYRTAVIVTLMALYLSMPWIAIGGAQAVRFNIIERSFSVFGFTFWATDTIYLFLLLGSLAFSLFFFTSLLGRVWCGWACPETVFLEFLFRPLERLIEGGPTERRWLDAAPWTLRKVRIKTTKLIVFAAVAWILASTLLAYFVGRHELLAMMIHSPAEHMGLFILTLVLMGVLLFQFGWFREQFCTLVCPYARFQSVLLDSNSLLVGYDKRRGEPRGKKRDASNGDCVDCALCVRVCPTGIDIRNGLQLECIQCASCIDACDSVMTKIGRPKGLIRYSTENSLAGTATRVLRPRVVVYGVILVVYLIALGTLVGNRKESDFQVIRESHDTPFSVAGDTVTNHFKIHIGNKSPDVQLYSVRVVEAPHIKAVVPVDPFPVAGKSLADLPLFIQFPKGALKGGRAEIVIEVLSGGNRIGTQKVGIIGPDL